MSDAAKFAPYPQTAPAGDILVWVRVLGSGDNPGRGVSDGLVYRTRRRAQSRAAWYRRRLRERGLETVSATRPSFTGEAWLFVLWPRGDAPGRAVERAVAERQRISDRREAARSALERAHALPGAESRRISPNTTSAGS